MRLAHRRRRAFDLSPREAIALQRRLAGEVVPRGAAPRPLRLVAGVDVSIAKDGTLCAAAVVCRAPGWEVVEEAFACGAPPMPYIPGLLSFREAPVVLDALAKVQAAPQVVLVDGQGLAHPRRIGLASHLGLFLEVPTIGVAKSIYVGTHDDLGNERGATAPLVDRGERVGQALRTRAGVKPVYVSVGSGIGLWPAVRIVLRVVTCFRLPEPVRHADRSSRLHARRRLGPDAEKSA